MGAASLKGLQFYDRLVIMLMPAKYQPDFMFLRQVSALEFSNLKSPLKSLPTQVPINRVHLFTVIQLACLVLLWVIKSFQATSILFPLMLVVMIGVRKSLDCIFTRRELKILDDIMPEMVKHDDLHHLEDGNGAEVGIFKKFVSCCIGDRPDKMKKRKTIMHS
jgi:sodium bicarbonate transporter 10